MKTLKELVAKGKKSSFDSYKHGCLWYITDCGLLFPIPAEDITGEAELNLIEDSMTLMKWIRKHMSFINESKKEQNV